MPILGLTVYLWSLDAQNRVLSSCLAPLVKCLRQEGLVSRFWFERMDIRGPHVFAPIMVPGQAAAAEVSKRLLAQLDDHLAGHPCPIFLTPAEIKFRSDYCRGKLQSAADRLPGLAENNTFGILPHDERDYPFHLSAGLVDEEELWLLLTELTLWSTSQFSGPVEGARQSMALRWFAAFYEAVRASLNEPERYWYYHASTLILNLEERLAIGGSNVLSQLSGSISGIGSDDFGDAWDELKEDLYPMPHILRIVQIIMNASELTQRQRFALLREIIHVGLKQLCLKVALHSPLVLFAWNRSLVRPTVVSAPAF